MMSDVFNPATAVRRLDGAGTGFLTHIETLPGREARPASWPDWIDPQVEAAVRGSGISTLWEHQRRAADLVHNGVDTVISTGTASGKSLGYQLPMLSAVSAGASAPTGRGATALYLAPTKALAADQESRIRAWAIPTVRAAVFDGDTPRDERRWIRDHAALILSNPDLLHHTLLPTHERWASFFRALQVVVVDECHQYRGVFGTHVSLVLRRLRRVAARYGADPVFVLASATIAEPAVHASALVGRTVTAVTDDASPRRPLTFGLWRPGMVDTPQGPVQRGAIAETADLMTRLVDDGVQTLAFATSRVGVERVADTVRHHLTEPTTQVAAYRGGYLPEERRELERDLRTGRLRGIAATNALELGIDVSGLDAVIVAGWPGTTASLWQQVGRAGRSGRESLALFVAADDPLDNFLISHPEELFGRPVEAAVINPENPHVLAPHLAAAAYEMALTEDDCEYFGPSLPSIADTLADAKILRRRPRGWFWDRDDRPGDHVNLRGDMGSPVAIVEKRTSRVLGTVDADRAESTVHTGAVYVHQGLTHVVTDFDQENATAEVVVGDPGWTTWASADSEFEIAGVDSERSLGALTWSAGPIVVRRQVTGFLRRLPTGEVIGQHPLDFPVHTLRTRGVWWTLPEAVLAAAGVGEDRLPGALHAAEHAAIGLLSYVAQSDRWDVGGVSTALHRDTGLPTIVVYDGFPGGAGIAERGFADAKRWIGATLDAVSRCRCRTGCPSCVQSPKCGNGNEPLDKDGAVTVLRLVLDELSADR
ncbi:DEAD/DEAH box helicase [Yimella sp. cx-51]|uniref:DEAD/DEAH box helicase n=2 Tax=Yimella sp. cx-51 TaxID=2770551 RepID=UPI00165D746D|nr:DEAD/DEAH box helicase [Yimella sp. cx-51]MBC9956418.1 DEAD/DEAH box helicase [Yimella sp. cx-51]QTH38465.1 DEAD/DEAH box helicase [Yimella sp. cx-51]